MDKKEFINNATFTFVCKDSCNAEGECDFCGVTGLTMYLNNDRTNMCMKCLNNFETNQSYPSDELINTSTSFVASAKTNHSDFFENAVFMVDPVNIRCDFCAKENLSRCLNYLQIDMCISCALKYS